MTDISANNNSLLTVDSLIRMYLHERGMVWHDYVRVLSVALSGVRDLAKEINIGSNYKALEITVDETNSVYLPNGCIKVNKVCIESGDMILPMANVDNMNPLQKFVNGDAVKRNPRPTTEYYDIGYHYNYVTRSFGKPVSQPYNYQVIGNRIQLDSRVDIGCILVLYTTNGTSMSDVNMIHPWAEEALKLWIDWKFPDMNRGIYEKRSGRKDYYDAKAALYGAIHGFSYEDYMEIVRKNNVLTYKN